MFKKLIALIIAVGLVFPTTPVRAEGAGPVQRLGAGIPTSVAAAPDGKTLAVGSSIGVWFLDVTTLTPTGFWDTGVWVDSVVYSVDGRYLRVNERVYELASGSVVEVGEVAWVDHRCSFDGRLCVEQDVRDGFVYSTKVVDTNTLIVTKMMEVGINDVAWSSDGTLLYTVGYEWRNMRNPDELVKTWDTKMWREVQRAENLFTNGSLKELWSSGENGTALDAPVTLWSSRRVYLSNSTTGQPIGDFVPHHILLWSASLSKDGQLLVTSGENTLRDCYDGKDFWYDYRTCKTREMSTRIWNVETRDLLTELSLAFYSPKFSNDGNLVIGRTQSHIEVWDWQAKERLWAVEESLNCFGPSRWGITCGGYFSLDPSGKFVASYPFASTGNAVRLYHLTTGELVATLTGHTAPITGVAFGPDGTKVAASSQDGTILIWDVP